MLKILYLLILLILCISEILLQAESYIANTSTSSFNSDIRRQDRNPYKATRLVLEQSSFKSSTSSCGWLHFNSVNVLCAGCASCKFDANANKGPGWTAEDNGGGDGGVGTCSFGNRNVCRCVFGLSKWVISCVMDACGMNNANMAVVNE